MIYPQGGHTLSLVLKEPLEPERVRRLIRGILQKGSVTFSGHSEKELANDGLSTVDAVNVLRAGVADPGEFERGCWRYRVRTVSVPERSWWSLRSVRSSRSGS